MGVSPNTPAYVDVWNGLVGLLLLPTIGPDTRAMALQYLTALNKEGMSAPSISTAHNASQWLSTILTR